ncbi:MBL fold metallo-hydrolase [Candidatus Bathyarchaeota archaeon]|nr:MAG: MBL fold metallo-hydrolase [Candidatus Bathyarchaeota archaeon]
MENSTDIKIKFLGGTGEVGRSALALTSGDTTLLLDYGILLNREPEFPLHISPKSLDGIVVSHAHLDHSGGVPIFYLRNNIPLYTTGLTFQLSRILINDLIKLSGYYLPYENSNLNQMARCVVYVNYGKEFRIGNFKLTFKEAGHIPGSFQTVVKTNKFKSLVYTGDINLQKTKLLNGADIDYGEVSCLILEATYANEDHPDRSKLEEAFVERVRSVVEAGGTVLVPAFSVGRSQEVLCILADHGFEYPVVMDGMALNVNEVMLSYPEYFRDYGLLRNALENAKWVYRWKERREAVNKPCVIVSPAGMLQGGAAAFYMGKVAKKKRNAIFLVSYQIPGTPGRKLLEEKKIFVNGKPVHVEAEVERFDFSSHAGRSDLEMLLKNVKGNPTVYLVHGSKENCQNLAEWVRAELGFEALAPSAGEVYKI